MAALKLRNCHIEAKNNVEWAAVIYYFVPGTLDLCSIQTEEKMPCCKYQFNTTTYFMSKV